MWERVGSSLSDADGVLSSEALAVSVIIAGGVRTREAESDSVMLVVSVSVNHDEFDPDGVFRVMVSLSDTVTPLPVLDRVADIASEAETDVVNVTVSLWDACSREND